jgi:hypothetical protein
MRQTRQAVVPLISPSFLDVYDLSSTMQGVWYHTYIKLMADMVNATQNLHFFGIFPKLKVYFVENSKLQ